MTLRDNVKHIVLPTGINVSVLAGMYCFGIMSELLKEAAVVAFIHQQIHFAELMRKRLNFEKTHNMKADHPACHVCSIAANYAAISKVNEGA